MKRLFTLLCTVLLLSGCSPAPVQEGGLTVTASTYPVYLFARAVTDGIPGVTVTRLDTGSVSCLHDYTLSVNDMKKIERADVLALSGAGLEDFMSDALAVTGARVIDCSQGVELLPAPGHHDHDHDHDHDHAHGHFDPHYWMDPLRAQTMIDNLCLGLSGLLPEQADRLQSNSAEARRQLQLCYDTALFRLEQESLCVPGLITFHDGFQYFAQALGLPLLRSIEEEAGSEASAKEIVDISRLVRTQQIPVIFTEVNGSDATAAAGGGRAGGRGRHRGPAGRAHGRPEIGRGPFIPRRLRGFVPA